MHQKRSLQGEFEHMAAYVERMWQRLMEGSPGGTRFMPRPVEPPVDVYQTEREVVVVLELAGLQDGRVMLELEGRRLTLWGERQGDQCAPGSRVYAQMEILCGPFRRTVFLPEEVDVDGVTANYDDGFLKITFPRLRGESQPFVRVQISRTELRRM